MQSHGGGAMLHMRHDGQGKVQLTFGRKMDRCLPLQ